MKSRRKLPKIAAYIMIKIVKFLVRIISEHLLKAIFLTFETETVGPCLVQKLKWVTMAPLAPPVATPLWTIKPNQVRKDI